MATVRIEPLTAAQARCVNEALALLQCEAESDGPTDQAPAVIERTRTKVHEAMARAGVTP